MPTTPLTLQPLDYGIILLLEKLKHPLLTEGKEITLSPDDLLNALLIFSAPDDAFEALQRSREEFDRRVFAMARTVNPEDLAGLKEQLQSVLGQREAKGATAKHSAPARGVNK